MNIMHLVTKICGMDLCEERIAIKVAGNLILLM